MYEHTYSEALLLAGECVATAYEHDDGEIIMDLCLLAGRMRGLIQAGEPTNSALFRTTYAEADRLLTDLGVRA